MANQLRILHALNVHNEEDIIGYNLDWYRSQGIDSIVVDNASTDGTKGILSSHLGSGVVTIKDVHTDHFDRSRLFGALTDLIHAHSPDWVVFSDADEFLQPFFEQDGTLKGLIEQADSGGYNLIQFHNMEFWMTPVDNPSNPNPIERIRQYSYFDSNRYKVFKFHPGFSLVPHRGHAPSFPEGVITRVLPEKGIMRHYKFRSLSQAYYKIHRIVPEPDRRDFGFHYAKFSESPHWFIIPQSKLTLYNNDGQWSMERKFDGNRMNRQEMLAYLGLQTDAELNDWFDLRKGVKDANLPT
ncbi:MAG: glycosyltransferase family 2 protein [Candidatus Woesearchaeota archaeon]